MAKMNYLQVGAYVATGKVFGKLPYQKSAEIALRGAEEGIVLLKNDNALPVASGKVALFGCGSQDTTVCGTGSGFAFSPYTVSIYDGLKKAGIEITSELWLKNYRKYKKSRSKQTEKLSFLDKRFSGMTPYVDVDVITEEEISSASAADCAIYVVKRNTGENYDRHPVKGDYYLSDNEKQNIRRLEEAFKKLIVVLNTCVIDCTDLKNDEKVSGIILLGQAGFEAGTALANIITGKVSPSGRLADTFAASYDDYPASKTFSANDGDTLQEDYVEDIYVGYRYFDSKKLDVTYPFGYGLSYTEFQYSRIEVIGDWEKISVSLDVTNIGSFSSKDVVQAYVSAPAGRLNKPYQELKGYAKTGLLKPGETQRIRIDIKTTDLASYDMENSCWLMEKGRYLLRLGKNSRDTVIIGAIDLDENVRTIQLSRQLSVDRDFEPLRFETLDTNIDTDAVIFLAGADYKTSDESSKISNELNCYVIDEYTAKDSSYTFRWPSREKIVKVKPVRQASLLDVIDNKISMEEFIATLDDEVLVRLVTGSGQETKYDVKSRLTKNQFKSNFNGSASGKTTNMFSASLGIPAASLADGPAGLHLMGTPTAAYPVGMVLAQTFNKDLIYEVGDCYGHEMEAYDIAICLGPGMNIHRDPLCGRNFEYYSEDPQVTGFSAAAFITGLQLNHPGYGVSAKHFCCNNQEIDRMRCNASVSERALREIYLKGFEIAVKEAQPLTIMSSYNLLNGVHTSSRYDLLTDVLRGEWGFKGFVMTDWDGESDRLMDLQAGNDILMGGYPSDILLSGIQDIKPEFNEDGFVKQKRIAMYGGAMHKMIDCYNSFLPDANGPDRVSVSYTGSISDSVKKLIAEGLVEQDTEKNQLVYKGYDRSNCLKRSVLQRNVMRILDYLAHGAPMKLAERR